MTFASSRSRTCLAALLGLFIVGCQSPSNSITSVPENTEANAVESTAESVEQKKVIDSLNWALDASVNHDVEQASQQGDYRLLVLATRGLSMPGIEVNYRAELAQMCGKKYLPGSVDVLINERHKKLYQEAMAYAKAYNQQMARLCRAEKTAD